MIRPLWKSTAGLWGPASFVAATVVGGLRQPGYDHRRFHISGLAAQGTRSASVMVPAFVTLGIAAMVIPEDGPTRALVRVAGVGTTLAGLFRCSDVRCPDPTRDPEATTGDAAHAAASIATFVVWTALPFVDAGRASSARARAGSLLLGAVTAVGFVSAGLTARSDDPHKGLAQRLFLAAVFTRYIARSARSLQRNAV